MHNEFKDQRTRGEVELDEARRIIHRVMKLTIRRVVQWSLLLLLINGSLFYYWSLKSFVHRSGSRRWPRSYLSERKEGTCTFKNCPQVKDDMINIHLIPHSHIDVGWVKNIDEYYLGHLVKDVWATGCVRCTFNALIPELMKNSSRRFVLSEMKYLARYWDEIDYNDRGKLQHLIKERRLEIINGGWVSSDAAVTSYNDIIDQHTLGFDFIRDKLGACAFPKTGWHLDQFGHSSEHASIFAQMGFDSLFIGRLDFEDLQSRRTNTSLEFVWETGANSLKDRSTLLTQILYDGYHSPVNFNFEVTSLLGPDQQIWEMDAIQFLHVLQERTKSYRTNHVLIPMGCDFGYKDEKAKVWFDNMDALIKKIHQLQTNMRGPRYNLIYSTPSCYNYHLSRAQVTLPVKRGDFHPYGIEPGFYWTGYFSTRGGLKQHIKQAGKILQSCKHLAIFTDLHSRFHLVGELRDAMATMQHHDTITGTSRLAVVKDYNFRLSRAEAQCEVPSCQVFSEKMAVMSEAFNRLLMRSPSNKDPKLISQFCHDLNISSCRLTEESKMFLMSLYNPLSWSITLPVRFPVQTTSIEVTDFKKKRLTVQVVPIPEAVMSIPERKTNASLEAVVEISLPPMSVRSFTVKTTRKTMKLPRFQNGSSKVLIENEHLLLVFSSLGKLSEIYNKDSDMREHLRQEFAYYEPDNTGEKTSGLYLFVPQAEKMIVAPDRVDVKVVKGDIVQEVHQTFNPWVSQVVRLHKGDKCAEFQWVVGPIPDDKGKEVISLFSSNLSSGNQFYTDSNGREMMTRTRMMPGVNKSSTHNPISSNYYPVTSQIYIQDNTKKVRLTILPDRPQGGSSLAPGSIELMVHRRFFYDDNLGVAETLTDQGSDGAPLIYTGKHYVCFEKIESSAPLTKHLALQIHLGPVPMFTPVTTKTNLNFKQHNFLSSTLPKNLQVLTLDRISEKDNQLFLLRLEHVFEEKTSVALSSPATVELQDLFKPFRITGVDETTLGGNFLQSDVNRLQWITETGKTKSTINSADYRLAMEPPFKVELRPMEIRTFRIKVANYGPF